MIRVHWKPKRKRGLKASSRLENGKGFVMRFCCRKDYLSNKDAAVELMVSQASQVKLSVSAARKQQ